MNVNETKVRIYNLALTKLGITERLTTGSEDCQEANAFNAVWEQVLHEVLELADWKCARKRAVLRRDTDAVEGATKAKPVVITAIDHSFEDGDLVKFSDVVGMTELNENVYMAKNPTLGVSGETFDTFDLWTEDGTEMVDGTGFGAWTSGGTIWRIPNWGYAYAFKLPDACIKVIQTGVDIGGWLEEHNIFLTNYANEELEILYIAYLSDPRYFSPLLADTVATRLGAVCAPALTKSKDKQQKLDQEFAGLLTLARAQDVRYRQEPDAGSTPITSM
jgi:hypothetical protein